MIRPPLKATLSPQILCMIDIHGTRWAGYKVIDPPAPVPVVVEAKAVDVRLR